MIRFLCQFFWIQVVHRSMSRNKPILGVKRSKVKAHEAEDRCRYLTARCTTLILFGSSTFSS